jgi:hypothetical protein
MYSIRLHNHAEPVLKYRQLSKWDWRRLAVAKSVPTILMLGTNTNNVNRSERARHQSIQAWPTGVAGVRGGGEQQTAGTRYESRTVCMSVLLLNTLT